MRHSNIAFTMGTYTDARLLDTAEAIEALPMFRTKPETATDATATSNEEIRETEAETTPRKLAPNEGQTGHIESIPDHFGTDDGDATDTKKPRKTQGVAGFLGVGGREFESPTSTMSTWRSNQLS